MLLLFKQRMELDAQLKLLDLDGVGKRQTDGLPASTDLVRIEKNLSTLGFFTPSKSRGRVEVRERTLIFRRDEDGQQVEVSATILPSAKYGLPSTADQDKYFAMQKVIQERRRMGPIENPIRFSSTDLLRIMGMRDSGTNYQDVQSWLHRMTVTGIISRGVVFHAGRRKWLTDTFHVFERVVTTGSDLGDGAVADCNYVWLSAWQLENINNNYLMPLDLERYWKLRGSIAKGLAPLLQLWLYASRSRGQFEKRYADLCAILDIKPQKHRSLVVKQLGPSLDELVENGYLQRWEIADTADGREFKLVAEHGALFLPDGGEGLPAPSEPATGAVALAKPTLLGLLVDRGLSERTARNLLQHLPEHQPVELQIQWVDYILSTSSGRVKNPPGFYVSLLKDDVKPPAWFLERLAQPVGTGEREAVDEHSQRELAYSNYRRQMVDTQVLRVLGAERHGALVDAHIPAFTKQYPKLPATTIREIAAGAVARDIERGLELISFEEYCRRPEGLFGGV